jgi:hypothetical protein
MSTCSYFTSGINAIRVLEILLANGRLVYCTKYKDSFFKNLFGLIIFGYSSFNRLHVSDFTNSCFKTGIVKIGIGSMEIDFCPEKANALSKFYGYGGVT